MTSLLDADILGGPPLSAFYAAGGVLVLLLVFGSWGRRAPLRRWLLRLVLLAVVGTGIGWLVGWWFSDVWNLLGIDLSVPTRIWLCAIGSGIGVAVGNLWLTRWWSKAVAIVAMPSIVLVGLLGINADLGEYRTLRAALLGAQIAPLTIPPPKQGGAAGTEPLWQSWVAPAGMPATGKAGTVSIPGVSSHFPARPAIVYLPPAALVANPPELPVMIVMSGQPGQPSDIVNKAGFVLTLDAYAKAHNGLAPIVVIPDQLGRADGNPMCVDSPLGNSESYLTVDVPNWINDHLHVSTDRDSWAIAGFSQGGTCAIQLGGGHPELFGSILDISGELAPANGSLSNTIAVGFGGSAARYQAATPLAILARHTPYPDTVAIFAVGQDDTRFSPGQKVVSAAARDAGMTVTTLEIPGTAHDWNCASTALRSGLDALGLRFGLAHKG